MTDGAETIADPAQWTDAPWMPFAFGEMGVKEIPGIEDNPRIVEYHASTAGPRRVKDETPWCSSFVNWCVTQAGLDGTRRKSARSWLRWGVQSLPTIGSVCVLWRVNPVGVYGHVGFYLGRTGNNVILLGGNQKNSVCVSTYPAARVLQNRTIKHA